MTFIYILHHLPRLRRPSAYACHDIIHKRVTHTTVDTRVFIHMQVAMFVSLVFQARQETRLQGQARMSGAVFLSATPGTVVWAAVYDLERERDTDRTGERERDGERDAFRGLGNGDCDLLSERPRGGGDSLLSRGSLTERRRLRLTLRLLLRLGLRRLLGDRLLDLLLTLDLEWGSSFVTYSTVMALP